MTQTHIYSTLTEVEQETRTVTGIAVPYGEITNNYGYPETFSMGAFEGAPLVQVFYQHDSTSTPIGRVQSFNDTDAGLEVTIKIAETPKGDEVYSLLKGGFLDSFSIGVDINESFTDDAGTLVHTKADLFEISVVNRPAFKGAVVREVFNEQDSVHTDNTKEKEILNESLTMENDNAISEIRDGLEELSREFSLLKETKEEVVPTSTIKSYGEFVVKNLAKDEGAKEFAYTGGTSAASVHSPVWVGDVSRLVEAPRKLTNVFGKSAIPADGLTLEYLVNDTDTTQAAVQATEGADIVMGNVSFKTASTGIVTIAAGSELTRQEIERAQVNIVDAHFRALGIKYANVAEARVRAAFDGAAATTIAGATITTFDNWTDFIVDASAALEDQGVVPDFIVVSRDVYKAAAKLSTANKYLLDRTPGGVNPVGLSGSIYGLPLVVVSGTNVATVASSEALTVYENSSPFNITQPELSNLTEKVAIYGYQAVAVENPKFLVKRGA